MTALFDANEILVDCGTALLPPNRLEDDTVEFVPLAGAIIPPEIVVLNADCLLCITLLGTLVEDAALTVFVAV